MERISAYFSILDQIAQGDVTQSEIEGALGMKSLGGQMKILEEKYGIIKKKRPIGAKEGSQTVRYEIQDNFFRFWFRYINRYAALIELQNTLIELQNMPALERIMIDDYTTFSGIALERWFRQKMMESCRYKQIGGWWQPNGVNSKGNKDDFEIDISHRVAEYASIGAYHDRRLYHILWHSTGAVVPSEQQRSHKGWIIYGGYVITRYRHAFFCRIVW